MILQIMPAAVFVTSRPAAQVMFGYVLSMLLLHELESRSRAMFAHRCGWRPAQQVPRGAGLGWAGLPIFFLLSGLIVWELVECGWELLGPTIE
jgi:hypothetical protein